MTNDTLKMGPNYSAHTVDKAPSSTYSIPRDYSSMVIDMRSCGGGGGGGAQAIYDGVFVDKDEHTGGGGGSAGCIIKIEIPKTFLIYKEDNNHLFTPFIADLRNWKLTEGSLGCKGTGGSWGYAHSGVWESGGVADATGGHGASAEPVLLHLESPPDQQGNKYWIKIEQRGGIGGSGGHAHAELNSNYTTPGSGGYVPALCYITYGLGDTELASMIITGGNTDADNMGIAFGLDTYKSSFQLKVDYLGTEYIVGSANIGTSEISLSYSWGGISSNIKISWIKGYSRKGGDGNGTTGGAGGTYTTETNGGKGGDGKESSGGQDGAGGSYINLTINRDRPYFYVFKKVTYDPSEGTYTATIINTDEVKVFKDYNSRFTHVNDIKYYNGTEWVRLNGVEYHYDSGSINQS